MMLSSICVVILKEPSSKYPNKLKIRQYIKVRLEARKRNCFNYLSKRSKELIQVFKTIQRITYLLTAWSRVLLEKLTVNFAASQEIPRIYGTRKFLTVPTSAGHLALS
jgi:hypothetical protein